MLYELAADPLGDSADPRRYVAVESHERALEALAAGIRAGRSPLLLTGASGVGKTLLLRVLAQRERCCGRVAVFSPFLHLAPDDVARWLLYLLGRPPSPEPVSDAALLSAVRLHPAPAMVVLVDEIQSAPAPSVERLTTLARAGGASLSLVVAGAPGSRLDALLAVLEPKETLALPDRLNPDELDTLCNAILSHPALERELRELARSDHDALVRAARGIPALLRNELVRRAAYVSVGASIPALDGEPEGVRFADLWRSPESATAAPAEPPRESEPEWPAWPDEHELELSLKRAPQPGHALWPQRTIANEMDLARWSPVRPSPASLLEESPPTPVSSLEPARTRLLQRGREMAAISVGLARAAARHARAAEREGRRLLIAALAQARVLAKDVASELAMDVRRQVERSRERAGPAAAALTAATRERLAIWERATREQRLRAIAVLRQKRRLSQDVALRLGTNLRRLPERTVPHLRAVAGRGQELGAATRAAIDALSDHARDAARGGGARVRSLRRQAPRLPRRTLTAAAALVVVALAPLHDASRVDVAGLAAVSSAATSAVAPTPATARGSPSPIRVQVNARPWALIRVDGVDAGPTPLSHLLLAAGPHDFEAQFPDGSVLHRRIQIGPDRRFVSLP